MLKRPKKRLVKADPVRREAFVSEYAALTAAARRTVKIFSLTRPTFGDGDLRGKWVLKGEPALVDSTSPRRGEKASYYSAVCLETGEVEVMELEGNSNSATSAAFLREGAALRTADRDLGQFTSPSWRCAAGLLGHARLNLCLVNLPSYSPDFNADEVIWGWAREEATANLCLGTRAAVQEKVGDFFTNLAGRREECAGCSKHAQMNYLALSNPHSPHLKCRFQWVLKGEPALVDSTSPRWGEKASYYSAVCLETGEVEVMELEGNSN